MLPALSNAGQDRYRQSDLGARCARAAPHWQVRSKSERRRRPATRFLNVVGGGIIAQRFNSVRAPAARAITYNSLFSVEGS